MRAEYHCSENGQAPTSAGYQDMEGRAYSQTDCAEEASAGKAAEKV